MGVRPFIDFLREQRRGFAHDELSDALNELVAAVAEHGKPGKLIFEITVKPVGNEMGGAVAVTDKIKIKTPEGASNPSVFFVSPENNLVREDPNQRSLELRQVSGQAGASPAELRDAGGEQSGAPLRQVG